MIKVNSKVEIRVSPSLLCMGLDDLVGKEGIVIEDLTDKERKNRGYIVKLSEPYEDEYSWFIPILSVQLC